MDYYTNIFTSTSHSFPIDLQGIIQPTVGVDTNRQLCTAPTIMEIHKVVFSMASNKSPGPDGMSPVFNKTYWHIIGKDVHSAVVNFFSLGQLSIVRNHTFITLIPKKVGANRMDQFRSISLCNVAYKIITKVFATRLKPILENHGFGPTFYKLIEQCISTTSYSILVNGSPCGFFQASRGIRQGDPISPTLFTIVADLLSRLIARLEESGRLNGIKIARSCPQITHLLYADDLVIYLQANVEEAREVVTCLTTYCQWTGQSISQMKSSVHFSANTPVAVKTAVCDILGIQECMHNGTYLGNLFCNFKSKKAVFYPLIEKLGHKLEGWRQRNLSSAGRAELIRTVAMSIPSYVMQASLLPVKICDHMDSMVRRFLWGGKVDMRSLCLKAWDLLCRPKCSRGLGFRRFSDVNIDFITKLGWCLCTKPGSLWVQMIRSKYLRGRQTLNFQHTSQVASWTWSGIRNCYGLLRKGICVSMG